MMSSFTKFLDYQFVECSYLCQKSKSCTVLFSATFYPYTSVYYRYTEMVRGLFEKQEDVTNYNTFWKFIEEDLIDGLYWETWYNRGYRNAKVNSRNLYIFVINSM